MNQKSLYERRGGYNSITAFVDDSITPIHRARTPPYFLQPCVQIVLTIYTVLFSDAQFNLLSDSSHNG